MRFPEICFFLTLAVATPTGTDHGSWHWEWDDSRIALTSNGPIIGHPAPNRSEVTEFLGIRYAESPVGDLRFAAPVMYGRHGVQNASAFVSQTLYGRTANADIFKGPVSQPYYCPTSTDRTVNVQQLESATSGITQTSLLKQLESLKCLIVNQSIEQMKIVYFSTCGRSLSVDNRNHRRS